jgi:Protein of unknown function (DUF2569)
MPIDIDQLRNRLSNLNDDELRKIAFANSHQYYPDTVQVAKEELIKRGYDIRQEENEAADTSLAPAEPRYKGVGGWLLLLCLGLTVFTPLLTIPLLAMGFSESSKYFNQFPGLLVITVTDTVLCLGLMVFSIYAGTGLWSIRTGAVQMAKRYLLCFLGYKAIAAILPFMAGLPSAATKAMIGTVAMDTLRGVIYFAVWYSYLSMSKRVIATYHS